MEKRIIIAIDGFSSCGKSTLAKAMAKALEYVFVDTGAMYRAIALYFLRNDIAFNDDIAIQNALEDIELRFKFNALSQKSDMYLNGEHVELLIREMQVSSKVSEVAAIEAVRDFAVAQQQAMGQQKGIVMDGRDIGTVVFPEAELKIFMTSSPETRAKRRFEELQAKGDSVSYDEVLQNVQERDYIDTHRADSPLVKAEDAVEIDNSHLTREEQFTLVSELVQEIITA